jgi:hypothetical protein
MAYFRSEPARQTAYAVEMRAGDERPHLGFGIGAGPDLQLPNAPHELARSRVWVSGDKPRIMVRRLDDPYRDDARVSAVRRYERATDLELLTKRMARFAVTGLFSGSFSNALLSSAQFPVEKPKEMKNFALDAPVG